MNFLEKIKIEKFTSHDKKEVKELIENIYSKTYFDKTTVLDYYRLLDCVFINGTNTFEEYSIKIIYRKKIIGIMLLSEYQLYLILEMYNDEKTIKNIIEYKDKEVLMSRFTGVHIKYQNKGLYSTMIEYVQKNYKKFDYLCGIQNKHKGLSNMDFFLKRRKVVAEIENSVYTVQDLK